MDGLVTAGGPAGSLLEKAGVIDVRNENLAGGGLLLEVALQTKGLVALVEQRWLTDPWGEWQVTQPSRSGLVLENERSALRGVTLETGVVFTEQSDAATFD